MQLKQDKRSTNVEDKTMTVGRICTRAVDLADCGESAKVAASRMNTRNVGTLVVCDNEKRPIGILTDRDLAIRVVAKGLDPGATTVESVMSPDPACVQEDAIVETAITLMRRGSHRRLVVVDENQKLLGLLSLDDILDLLSEEFEEIGKLVREESPNALAL